MRFAFVFAFFLAFVFEVDFAFTFVLAFGLAFGRAFPLAFCIGAFFAVFFLDFEAFFAAGRLAFFAFAIIVVSAYGIGWFGPGKECSIRRRRAPVPNLEFFCQGYARK